MMRWMWKRWVWAVLAGAAVAGSGSGLVASESPRPNDTITLRFPGQPDRKVKVVKISMLADGNVETEVRDPATGQTFTLVEPAKAKAAPVTRAVEAPKPITPISKPVEAPKIETPANDENSTTQVGGSDRKLFPALRPSAQPSYTPAPAPLVTPAPLLTPAPKPSTTPAIVPAPSPGTIAVDETSKRPGPLQRMFGKKATLMTPSTPSMPVTPSAIAPTVPGPIYTPPPPVTQPTRAPTPVPVPMPMPAPIPSTPSTRIAPPPPNFTPSQLPLPSPTVSTPVPNTTAEPPRTINPKPVTPPTPVLPTKVPIPTTPPNANVTPVPSLPLPNPVPTNPGGGALPIIPLPPGGQSKANGPAVVPAAGYTPPAVAVTQELQPHIHALATALRPSERIIAAGALANGRHGSTPAVKAVLFDAAKNDPAPAVRACCIEKLCQLGFYEKAFLDHLKAACDDSNDEVRYAAKAALVKMTPRQR